MVRRPIQKSEKVGLLIATPAQTETFLPKPILEELRGQFDRFERLDPTALESVEYERVIQETNPHVIITGWKTKPLPTPPPDNLKYICHLAGTVRSFFPTAYFANGIRLSNWGDSIAPCIAEMALLGILNGLRKTRALHRIMHEERSWTWDFSRSRSLFARSVGIHGFGSIARELIALLAPFGTRVSVYSDPVPHDLIESQGLIASRTLKSLFESNEIIVELEALTTNSSKSVTIEHLSLIPEGGVFVNAGRGEVVDEAALYKIAKEGKIQMVLDVYHQEPLPKDSELRALDNVQLSPHSSGPTPDLAWRAGTYAVENIKQYFAGESLNGGEITEHNFDLIT